MSRAFAEPATSWRGAFLRAAAWSGPAVCGAYLVGQAVPAGWRIAATAGLLLGAMPAALAARERSWRVGVASASVAMAVLAAAMAIVAAIFGLG